MLMAAAAAAYMHMDSTQSSAGSTISPQPWHTAVPVAIHQQHQPALYDRDLAAPSPAPSPSPTPTPRNQQQLRPGPGAARRPSSSSRRRRPRPSRKVPTTYIAADTASFRRMVHQVTGAHDLLPPPLARPLATQHGATTLCRPAPSRAAVAAAPRTLPTLDTSALLLGIGGAGSTRRASSTGPAGTPVRPASALSEVHVGSGGSVGVEFGGAGYSAGGGFPTLESWDALLY